MVLGNVAHHRKGGEVWAVRMPLYSGCRVATNRVKGAERLCDLDLETYGPRFECPRVALLGRAEAESRNRVMLLFLRP